MQPRSDETVRFVFEPRRSVLPAFDDAARVMVLRRGKLRGAERRRVDHFAVEETCDVANRGLVFDACQRRRKHGHSGHQCGDSGKSCCDTSRQNHMGTRIFERLAWKPWLTQTSRTRGRHARDLGPALIGGGICVTAVVLSALLARPSQTLRSTRRSPTMVQRQEQCWSVKRVVGAEVVSRSNTKMRPFFSSFLGRCGPAGLRL
jgi:hypothetical protein